MYDIHNPVTKGRPCPMMGKKCPGTHEGCSFWRTQEVTIGNDQRVISNCLFVLEFEIQYQGVAEQIRTKATIQHMNNQIHMTVLALQRGIEIPALSGNLEKDVALIKQFEAGGAARQLAAELQDGRKGEGPPGR